MGTMSKLLFLILLGLFGCIIPTEEETMPKSISGGNVQGGGWSQSGKLITGNDHQKVTLQAQFPFSDVYTVQFGIDAASLGFSPKVVADITWSVAGNRVYRRVSPNSGVSISGRAEAIDVKLTDITDASFGAHEYVGSILVSPGVRASTSIPPTLVNIDTFVVPALSVVQKPIPQNVGVVSVLTLQRILAGVIAPENLTVRQFDGVGLVASYDPREYTDFVPIVAGAAAIIIANNDATDSVQISLVWGIDG